MERRPGTPRASNGDFVAAFAQRDPGYEAADNLHGRWSLPGYRQITSQLAAALESGVTMPPGRAYDDCRGKSTGKPLPVGVTGLTGEQACRERSG